MLVSSLSIARAAARRSFSVTKFNNVFPVQTVPSRFPNALASLTHSRLAIFRSLATNSSPPLLSRLQRLLVYVGNKVPSTSVEKDATEQKLELSRLLSVAYNERKLIGFALAAQLVSATSIMVFPMALGNIVDAVTGSLATNLDSLVMLMGGVFTISGIATATRVSTMSLAGSRISRQLRVNLYQAMLKQDTAFFDVRQSGELINRLSNDVPLVSRTLTENLAKILRSGVTAASSLALIVYLSPKLSLVTLCSVPPIVLSATLFGRNARRMSRHLTDALASATQVAAERMAAVRTVRIFGAERLEAYRYARYVDDTYGLAKQVAFADGTYAGSIQLAAQMSLLGVLWFGGRMVLDASDPMTIGALTSFSMYAVNLGVSIAGVGTAYGHLTRALGAGHRLFEIIDRKPQGRSSTLRPDVSLFPHFGRTFATPVVPNAVNLRDFEIAQAVEDAKSTERILQPGYNATVQFENVHFTYPTRPESEVLSGVNLEIRPGEIMAIAGTSGSGKSTLSSLLSRLYEPTSGRITLDGTPINTLDTAWLRRQVAVVSQEPVLFSGSIGENIRYGTLSDVTLADVTRAARAAASHDMIMGLEGQYGTLVGERGTSLSGGQRARAALCRALVRQPRVLVLDEHSAALDAESERAVAQAVSAAASKLNLAVITIAHRRSSLQRADRVAVLVNGQVAEMDSYERLMSDEHSYLRRMLIPQDPDSVASTECL